jgi:hypothetical protein
VSIGLGPEKQDGSDVSGELIPGQDYDIPDHESLRTSRRSKIDEKCDGWFGSLLGDSSSTSSFLGKIAQEALTKLKTPVELKNEVSWFVDDWIGMFFITAYLPFILSLSADHETCR